MSYNQYFTGKPEEWVKAVVDCENVPSYYIWKVDREEQYNKYWSRFIKNFNNELIPLDRKQDNIKYHSEVVVMPNGKQFTPIRQFCQRLSIPEGSTITQFIDAGHAFFSVTDETIPAKRFMPEIKVTNVKISAVGSMLSVRYVQLSNSVIDLVNSINKSYSLESIKYENVEVIVNLFKNNIPNTINWLNGDGYRITSDTKLRSTLNLKSIIKAKEIITNQGFDNSNLILATNHQGIISLIADPYLDDLCIIQHISLPDIVTQEVIEKILGIRIMITELAPNNSNTIYVTEFVKETRWQRFKRFFTRKPKPTVQVNYKEGGDGYRSILFMPDISFGLAGRDKLVMEAQRRNELQSIYVTGTNRLGACIKNEETVVVISHK